MTQTVLHHRLTLRNQRKTENKVCWTTAGLGGGKTGPTNAERETITSQGKLKRREQEEAKRREDRAAMRKRRIITTTTTNSKKKTTTTKIEHADTDTEANIMGRQIHNQTRTPPDFATYRPNRGEIVNHPGEEFFSFSSSSSLFHFRFRSRFRSNFQRQRHTFWGEGFLSFLFPFFSTISGVEKGDKDLISLSLGLSGEKGGGGGGFTVSCPFCPFCPFCSEIL